MLSQNQNSLHHLQHCYLIPYLVSDSSAVAEPLPVVDAGASLLEACNATFMTVVALCNAKHEMLHDPASLATSAQHLVVPAGAKPRQFSG
jgi:hypothetical protein